MLRLSSKKSLCKRRISPGQTGLQKFKTKLFAVSCVLTLLTALSVNIPAQATHQSANNTGATAVSSQTVFVGSILDFFSFLGFNSNQPQAAAVPDFVVDDQGVSCDSSAAPVLMTIQAAVTAASDGNTIKVCAGTYTENVNINGKSLTINGPEADVDARTRTAQPEAIVNGGTGSAFTVSSNTVTINGFTFSGTGASGSTSTIFLQGGTDHIVSNNIFDSSVRLGSYFSSPGTTFEKNRFTTTFGGTFGGVDNTTVQNNLFDGTYDDNGGAVNTTISSSDQQADNFKIINNQFTASTGNFAVVFITNNGLVDSNTVTGADSSAIFIGGGNTNLTVSNNTIKNGTSSAVSLSGGFGYSSDAGINILSNNLEGNLRGIRINSGQFGADTTTGIEAHFNRIKGNSNNGVSSGIVNESTTATVNATNNFFGCNEGPTNTPSCDGVIGNVTATPFLKFDVIAQSPINNGGTSTITARFISSDPNNTTPALVIDGIPVIFSGAVNATVPTMNGVATTTYQDTSTTGDQPPVTVTGTVDNASDDAVISVEDMTAPTVVSVNRAAGEPDPRTDESTPFVFTVTFSEAVTGVDSSDFSVTTTGGITGTPAIAVSADNGTTRTVTVSGFSNGNVNGTVRLNVLDDDTIIDVASNPLNGGFTNGQTYTVLMNDPNGANCVTGQRVYNVVSEFSLGGNPNCVYTYGNTASPSDDTFSNYTIAVVGAFQTPGIDGWYTNTANRTPGIYKNNNGTTTQYVEFPSVVQPASTVMLHPGQNGERSVLRFTVPPDGAGSYNVAGSFQGIDTGGTTTDVSIFVNSTSVFSGNINGYNDTKTFNFPITVAAGDNVDFRVGYGNGSFGSDSTALIASLSPTAIVVDDDGMAALNTDGTPNCGATTAAPNTIQSAIDLSSAGDTIYVCPGTYVEELNINKQLTLLGPNANVNPNTGTRTAEAIINPTTSDPDYNTGPIMVSLRAQNVTFNGFTLDGNNPNLTSGVIFNGVDVDAAEGIDMPDNNFTGLNNPRETITNNIIQNIGDLGIALGGNGAANNDNSTIQFNKIDNIPGVNYGGGVYVGNNAYTNVTDNVITRISLGVVTENFSQAGSTPASVSNNQIMANRIGMRHNLHYVYSTPGYTISNNSITSYIEASDPTANRFSGIRIESIHNPVTATFSGNTINIPNRAALQTAGYTRIDGIFITNDFTDSPNITITGNNITNALRGISQNTPAVPNVNCNYIANNDVGVYVGNDVQFGGTTSYATNGIIINNNNIVGNTMFGVQSDTTGIMNPVVTNAQMNYWGAADGPGPVGPGSGDKVTTNVDFTNFLAAPTTCAPVVPPTVTINQASGQNDPTNTQPINFTVVFSEAVTGFDNSDVVLSGTAGATMAVVTEIAPNDGTTYNVAVSGITNDGTVIAMIRVAAAQSVATGAPTSASTSNDNTVTYDTTPPMVTVSPTTGQPDPTNSTVSFTIVFSEPTTDFTQGDVTVTNGTITSFSGSGTTYTVVVTPTATGPVTAMVAAGVATDAAGNPNTASNTASVNFDGTSPTVTVDQAAGQADPTSTSPINFTVVFSEPVTGFGDAASDVTISGTAFGVGSNPTAVVTQNNPPNDGTSYNVAVSGMNQSGTVTVTIPAGAAVDNVGNPNTASTSTDNTVTFNLANTIVTVNPTNTNTAGPTMWFGFDDNTNTLVQPSYVVGPTGQPLGVGSSRIRTSDTGRYLFANNTTYAGTRLDQITELSYSEYANNPGNTAKAPSLQLGFDFNLNDASEAFNGRLVFEPYQNTTAPNQPLVQGTWQRWNATNGLFYTSSSTLNGNPTPCPQSAPCTRAQLLAAFPNAGIHRGGLGLIGFRGEGSSPGIGFEGNVDALTVGVNSVNTTFDFEPTPPTISIGNAMVTEGNSGTTAATFTITQSQVSQLDTTVTINTADGSATVADNDYQPIAGSTATILAGQTSTTVTVNVVGDTNVEGNETFTVTLSNAVNAAIADPQGLGTINNDDVTVSFSSPTYSIGEAGGTATITVTRTGVTPNPVSVNYATSSGSATGGAACTTGVDFINTSGTLTFAGNETTKTFTVTICDDNISEPPPAGETVNLTLSNPTGGAMLGLAAATLTIVDNDGSGLVTISGNIQMYNAPAANTNLQGVTVTLSGSASQTTTTDQNGNYSFTGLTAGGSYQVTPSGLGKIYDPIYRNYSSLTVNITNANFIAYNSINDVPRRVRFGQTTVSPGNSVTIPVLLDALGNENGVSFSFTYDTTKLSNPVVTLGTDAAGATLFANNGTPGSVGVTLVKPSGQTFGAAGTKQIVNVQFNTATNTSANTALTFTNSPVTRSVNDVNANPLQSQFINGTVVFAQGLEADVDPRPSGDGDVDLGDFNQVGQFAAGLATPDFATTNEFQRADCEPTATKGDADVDLGDFIQAGRYAAVLDPTQSVGGPAYPTMMTAVNLKPIFETNKSSAVPRIVSAANVDGSPGNTVTVAVQIDAESNDKGTSFTLDYDTTKLSNPQVSLGSGGSGGFLVPNTNISGKVIVQLAYITGGFQAGVSQIILIQFTIANNAAAGVTPLTFNDTPVQRQVRDTNNVLVASTFNNGGVNILGATASGVSVGGKVQNMKGRGVANTQITMTDSRGEMRTVRSNPFGFFTFTDVPAGEAYTINIRSKQYTFATQVVNVSQNLNNLVFTADK